MGARTAIEGLHPPDSPPGRPALMPRAPSQAFLSNLRIPPLHTSMPATTSGPLMWKSFPFLMKVRKPFRAWFKQILFYIRNSSFFFWEAGLCCQKGKRKLRARPQFD